MKKFIAIALAVLTVSGTVFARGNSDAGTSAGEVKIIGAISGGKDDAENLLFAEALSKATGLRITFEKPPSYDQVLMQKLGAGEQYDLIYIGQNNMYQLAEMGVIQDLTGRFKNSAITLPYSGYTTTFRAASPMRRSVAVESPAPGAEITSIPQGASRFFRTR
jgi:putative aldouronate transport system substrate-binding protein